MKWLTFYLLVFCTQLWSIVSVDPHPYAVLEESDTLSYPFRVCFDPFQNTCCVCDTGKREVQLYAIKNGNHLEQFSKLKVSYAIQDLDYTANGKYLATIDQNKGNIFLYPVKSEGIESKTKQVIEGKKSGIIHPTSIALSPDGQLLAVSLKQSHSSVYLFEKSLKGVFQKKPLLKIPSKPLEQHGVGDAKALAFSPDGKLLAVTHIGDVEESKQSALVIYRKETYQNPKGNFVLQSIVFLDQRPLEDLAFYPDSKTVAVVDRSEGILFFSRDDWNSTYRHEDTLYIDEKCLGVSFHYDGDFITVSTAKPSLLFYHIHP